jgi:hypothetical protein
MADKPAYMATAIGHQFQPFGFACFPVGGAKNKSKMGGSVFGPSFSFSLYIWPESDAEVADRHKQVLDAKQKNTTKVVFCCIYRM